MSSWRVTWIDLPLPHSTLKEAMNIKKENLLEEAVVDYFEVTSQNVTAEVEKYHISFFGKCHRSLDRDSNQWPPEY
jgi:hypothetical protein